MKKPGKREPRSSGSGIPATWDEAQEALILSVMRPWPARLEAVLKANGIEGFAGGDDIWEAKFEAELMNPRDPETLGTVKWLAEHGHQSARRAMDR
jgi:hypothetical protein